MEIYKKINEYTLEVTETKPPIVKTYAREELEAELEQAIIMRDTALSYHDKEITRLQNLLKEADNKGIVCKSKILSEVEE